MCMIQAMCVCLYIVSNLSYQDRQMIQYLQREDMMSIHALYKEELKD